MESWVHHCVWCGWSRHAASPTMLAPHCENCGGLLESAPAGAVTGPSASLGGGHGPRISPAFGRLLRTALVGLLLFAAARFGRDAGGFGLALAAIGVVGLFTFPLIVGE